MLTYKKLYWTLLHSLYTAIVLLDKGRAIDALTLLYEARTRAEHMSVSLDAIPDQ